MEQTTTTTMANPQEATGCVVADLGEFDALVRTEQRRIYRVLLAILRDLDAADSLTQECFLKAYENRNRFRGECSVRTWLVRIAVNLAKDHAKSRRRQFWRKLFSDSAGSEEVFEAVDQQASPERSLLARERLAHVSAAVDQLPDQQRTVFTLRFLEEMTIEEIAQAMSLRPGTVKAHLFRAVNAIRRHLQERNR